MTWVGGLCWSPRAVRRIENTTTSRVKLVIRMRIDGASVSTVISKMSWTGSAYSPSSVIVTPGIGDEAGAARATRRAVPGAVAGSAGARSRAAGASGRVGAPCWAASTAWSVSDRATSS